LVVYEPVDFTLLFKGVTLQLGFFERFRKKSVVAVTLLMKRSKKPSWSATPLKSRVKFTGS